MRAERAKAPVRQPGFPENRCCGFSMSHRWDRQGYSVANSPAVETGRALKTMQSRPVLPTTRETQGIFIALASSANWAKNTTVDTLVSLSVSSTRDLGSCLSLRVLGHQQASPTLASKSRQTECPICTESFVGCWERTIMLGLLDQCACPLR